MKTKLLSILLLAFLGLKMNAQNEKCGTMQNLQQMMAQDPTLKARMDSMEIKTQEWIKNSETSRMRYFHPQQESPNAKSGNPSTQSLCGYDNTLYLTWAAPTTVAGIVSDNTVWGGDYIRVNNMVAGRIYRISTCAVNTFDTQISVYTAGGGTAVAHNDDWCGSQSEIYFNPLTSGNYDILIDEYNCISNQTSATLEVELVYIPRPVITIPVVVHIIHFGEPIGTGRNLSVAQIQSQIDVLNEDFRRLNSDISITPAAFRGGSDDALVQFCLAQQDESGNATTGIVRYLGSQAQYSMSDMNLIVKPTTIWDRDSYLNIWAVDLTGGLLGFAQFPGDIYPGDTPYTDGIVIYYNCFGRVGNLNAQYNLGRTATHEVGHWLDLRHIWADEPACAADDFVADTPLQADNNSGVPTFPLLDACATIYPGAMFYNYMDYCDDNTLTMFTVGQASRMDAALFGPRLPLQSSIGCQQTTLGMNESGFANSIKLFPNPSTGIFTIQLNEKLINSELKVTNSIGQVVLAKQLSKNSEEFNLSEFSNGVYFLIITSPLGVVSKKLVLDK